MATKTSQNGHAPAETTTAETVPERQYLICGELHTMRSLRSLSWADQIRMGRLQTKQATLQTYFELDDDDEEIPPEVEAAWEQTIRRIAKLGFPSVSETVWTQLSPMELTELASAFGQQPQDQVGNVRPVGGDPSTPTGSSTKPPASNGSMVAVTPASG